MLNSRDILHGRGVNEEESAISTRKINPGLSSSSGGSHSGAPVRFNVSDSKVQSFNIEVSQTIDIEHDEADKVRYDADDNSSVSLSWQFGRSMETHNCTAPRPAQRQCARARGSLIIPMLAAIAHPLFIVLSAGMSLSPDLPSLLFCLSVALLWNFALSAIVTCKRYFLGQL